MTHYIFAATPKEHSINREKWETFAAFVAFAALVAVAGATYGSLLRDDVYAEVQGHEKLTHFSGMLGSSVTLPKELRDKGHNFTIIAPTDAAFDKQSIAFASDEKNVKDKRIVTLNGESYILQGEGYIVRSQVMPQDVPVDKVLELPSTSGELVSLTRTQIDGETQVSVNGVPVLDRILADNGVIYLVEELIHPLPIIGR